MALVAGGPIPLTHPTSRYKEARESHKLPSGSSILSTGTMFENLGITFDDDDDNFAYLSLTGIETSGELETVEVPVPASVKGTILLDFHKGMLVGIEILGATTILPP